MIKRLLIWGSICAYVPNLSAIFPANIFELDYTKNTPPIFGKRNHQLGIFVQGMLNANGHNELGDRVNILQIWQPNQDSLTMLRGFDANTQIGALADSLNTASDDGIRGHLVPTAKMRGAKIDFTYKHALPYHLSVNMALPLFNLRLKDVSWIDLTKNITFADQQVHNNLTNHLGQIVYDLGDKLDIVNGWEKTGLGDLLVTIDWRKMFYQSKPILKAVTLGLAGGLSLPTGIRQNEDLLMFPPFGNDGSVGIVFSGLIEVQWWQHLHGGINAIFLDLFGATRNRRIKTDPNQTDLLLLAKTAARKEWGFTQQYQLYLEAFEIWKYLAARTMYSYIKHNNDTLYIFNQSYSSEIANTAASLREWTQHSIIFSLMYKGPLDLELHYQHAFNGKNTIQSDLFAFSLTWNF